MYSDNSCFVFLCYSFASVRQKKIKDIFRDFFFFEITTSYFPQSITKRKLTKTLLVNSKVIYSDLLLANPHYSKRKT